MRELKLFSKPLFIVGLLLSLLVSLPLLASSEFDKWMQQQSQGVVAQKKEFQEYKDKRDKEFTAFLKAQWKPVDIVKGEERDETPKPQVMPVASPAPVVPEKIVKPVAVVVPRPVSVKKPVAAPPVVAAKGRPVNINFFGKQLQFYYAAGLKQKFSTNINKDAVSKYWSALSRAGYEDLLKQLTAQKKSLQLNDWAYAALVNELAAAINTNRRNETALLSWFLLVKSDYKARIAYNKNAVYLLVPSKHEIFEVSYFTFSGTRYYAIEFDGKHKTLGQVYTYDGEYPGTNKEFDMRVSPMVASIGKGERRHLSFKFDGKKYNINVAYDRGRIKFFKTYPQLNLNLYFGSGVFKSTATPLQKQLASHMQGMSELQAVNFLLRFVQTALQYETDEQQFGEENYLFPEETLFYPYSDCEDRAILFAWLVQGLLNLQVVGLDYPGHVATAVKFNEKVKGDSVSHQGQRYVVADPTYINASAGMSMPDFKQFKPTVIDF